MTQSPGRVMSRRRSTADAKDAATAQLLEEAAELARSRGAPSVAAELGEASARATPPNDEDDRRRRTIQAVRAHLAAGSAGRALTLGRELVEGAGPGPARAEALALLADVENAVDVEHGGRPLPPGSSRARSSTRARAGASPRARGQPAHHRGPGRRGGASAEGGRAGRRNSAATCSRRERLRRSRSIRFNQGEPEAFALAQQAVELALPTVDAAAIEAAMNAWGHCLFWSGRIDEARTRIRGHMRDRPPGETSPPRRRRSGTSRSSRSGLAGWRSRESMRTRSRELTFQYAGHELDEPAVHMPLARIAAFQGDVALAREPRRASSRLCRGAGRYVDGSRCSGAARDSRPLGRRAAAGSRALRDLRRAGRRGELLDLDRDPHRRSRRGAARGRTSGRRAGSARAVGGRRAEARAPPGAGRDRPLPRARRRSRRRDRPGDRAARGGGDAPRGSRRSIRAGEGAPPARDHAPPCAPEAFGARGDRGGARRLRGDRRGGLGGEGAARSSAASAVGPGRKG